MLSKWFPWDFFKTSPFAKIENGAYLLSSYNPFMERFVLDELKKNSSLSPFRIIVGEDLTVDWLEENVNSFSLFGAMESILILDCENISSACFDFFQSDSFSVTDQVLVLSFTKKSDFFNELSKIKSWIGFKIEAPRFWEMGQLLTFILERQNIRLSYSASQYFLSAVPEEISEYVTVLQSVKLSYPDELEISEQQLKNVLSASKIDGFALAALLSQKKTVLFLEKVLELPFDFETYRQLFSLIQFHFLKLSDTSYVAKKKKASKYDKQILSHAGLWNSGEIQRTILYFKKLEILAKSKDPTIIDQIRLTFIESLSLK